MISTVITKAPTYAGAFAARGTDAVTAWGARSSEHTTGLPVGMPVRLRPAADVPVTGLPIGTAVQLNSDIPGDLPPRDPLS